MVMRSSRWLPTVYLVCSAFALGGCREAATPAKAPDTASETPPAATASAEEPKQLFSLTAHGQMLTEGVEPTELRVTPGKPEDADAYYNAVKAKLENFPKKLQESTIPDMLAYQGYGDLKPEDLELLDPAAIMKLPGVKADEILVTRFFAPKIINVSAPQTNDVPKGGFGWRKVLRFKSRAGSGADKDNLDSFYLLFNFTSDPDPKFPAGKHAGQIQAILKPKYPTASYPKTSHRDLYFLVYESLDGAATPNPGRIRGYLEASFDLVGLGDNSKYYVPVSCAQCHGSEFAAEEQGAKVNYLDTDHWFDRASTKDDFGKVQAASVLPDGTASYETFRKLNVEIKQQNEDVGGKDKFAWLATSKWLELHAAGGPYATSPAPPLKRGFAASATDRTWTDGASPDTELLPLLNRYCFRCHSSIRFHVFQKQTVFAKKDSMINRLKATNTTRMPQDRKLDPATSPGKDLIRLLGELK